MATKKLLQKVSSKTFSTKFHGADNASVEAVAACLMGECSVYDLAGTSGTEADGKTTPATHSTGLFQFKNTATGSVGYWHMHFIKSSKTIDEITAAIKTNMKCPDGTTPDVVTAMGYRQVGA